MYWLWMWYSLICILFTLLLSRFWFEINIFTLSSFCSNVFIMLIKSLFSWSFILIFKFIYFLMFSISSLVVNSNCFRASVSFLIVWTNCLLFGFSGIFVSFDSSNFLFTRVSWMFFCLLSLAVAVCTSYALFLDQLTVFCRNSACFLI